MTPDHHPFFRKNRAAANRTRDAVRQLRGQGARETGWQEKGGRVGFGTSCLCLTLGIREAGGLGSGVICRMFPAGEMLFTVPCSATSFPSAMALGLSGAKPLHRSIAACAQHVLA